MIFKLLRKFLRDDDYDKYKHDFETMTVLYSELFNRLEKIKTPTTRE